MNESYPGPHKVKRDRPQPEVHPTPQSMSQPLRSPAWHVSVAEPLTTLMTQDSVQV